MLLRACYTGPHAVWGEDAVADTDGKLPIKLAFTIQHGKIEVQDKILAKALADDLPKDCQLQKHIYDQLENPLPAPSNRPKPK